jgi:hypothetical protein
MSALVNFFLRARHWQIFLLVFVVPTIVEIAATDYVPTTIRSWRDLGEGGLVYLGLMLLDAFCLLAWLWAMGSFLNSLQNPAVRLKPLFFRVAMVYVPAYMLIFFSVFFAPGLAPPIELFLPLHLLAIFCMSYTFWFVAKNLAMVNKRRQVAFSDYAKLLLMLFLFPIGVWQIQPRINQLYAHSKNV